MGTIIYRQLSKEFRDKFSGYITLEEYEKKNNVTLNKDYILYILSSFFWLRFWIRLARLK